MCKVTMGKRKRNPEEIQEKINKLQKKLEKELRENISPESTASDSDTPDMVEPEPEIIITELFGDQNPSASTGDQPEEGEAALDAKVLEILGDCPATKEKLGPPIHDSIASRWTEILSCGLNKDQKSNLLKEYTTPSNCPLISAPQLNLEIKAAVNEAISRKDKIYEIKQKQLGAALSCLGRAMDILIKGSDHHALKAVNDAARLLCDQQYFEVLSRRQTILAVLNKTTKDAIQGVKPDEWLFGRDLTERIKACKAITRSASDLKNRPRLPLRNTTSTASSSALNWRGPSQQLQHRLQPQGRGGPRQVRPTHYSQTQYRGRIPRRL